MKISIPCYVYENGGIFATNICRVEENPDDGCIFHVVTENVNLKVSQCLRDVSVRGTKLSEYEPEVLSEWLKAMKEENETSRKKYFYDDDGDEYWYNGSDFSRHYTRMEG